jgi:hypothetical protein
VIFAMLCWYGVNRQITCALLDTDCGEFGDVPPTGLA